MKGYTMKMIIQALCFIIVGYISAQRRPQAPLGINFEIYAEVVNASGGTTTDIVANVMSVSWDENDNFTNNYSFSSVTITGSNPGEDNFGWDFVTSHDPDDPYPVIAHGLYKFSVPGTNFYIDYRDCNMPYSGGPDIWIRYDNNLGTFAYKPRGSNNFTSISNEQTLNIWEILDQGAPVTACFQPTTPSNFSGNANGNDNPALTWNAVTDPPGATIKYEVRRNLNWGGWTTIVTNLTSSSYTDNSVIASDECEIKYQVRSYIPNNKSSSWSNSKTYSVPITIPGNFWGDSYNNHPRLHWDASTGPDGYTVKYKVWRKYRPTGEPWEDWGVIASNLTNTTYLDYGVVLRPRMGLFHYRVHAYVICGTQSGYSNTVAYSGSIWYKQMIPDYEQSLPEEYSLKAYPNPFNPATTIHYALPELSNVKITIYDIMGHEVITLINGFENTGFKEIVWEGINTSGHPVPSGMYFYRLDAKGVESGESFHQSKKMIMMR